MDYELIQNLYNFASYIVLYDYNRRNTYYEHYKYVELNKGGIVIKENTYKFFILPIVISAILFFSIGDLPYGFYTFMRIVVPILSVIYLFFAFNKTDEFNLMMIPNILIVILWNPIFPVYMEKETWVMIDAIFGICELGVAYYAYRLGNPVKQRQSTTTSMSYENYTKALFEQKLASNFNYKEFIEGEMKRQIEQLESYIEQANDAIKHPELYKPESQSLIDFVVNQQKCIEEAKIKISRLKAGDIALSEEMLKSERWS